MIDNSEDMSTTLNKYFFSVSTHENLPTIPDADLVFSGREDEKLMILNITR